MYTIVGNIFRTSEIMLSDEEGNITRTDFYNLSKEILDNTQNVTKSNLQLQNFNGLPKYDNQGNPVTSASLVQICYNPIRVMDATQKVYEIDEATLLSWKANYTFYTFERKI